MPYLQHESLNLITTYFMLMKLLYLSYNNIIILQIENIINKLYF